MNFMTDSEWFMVIVFLPIERSASAEVTKNPPLFEERAQTVMNGAAVLTAEHRANKPVIAVIWRGRETKRGAQQIVDVDILDGIDRGHRP